LPTLEAERRLRKDKEGNDFKMIGYCPISQFNIYHLWLSQHVEGYAIFTAGRIENFKR
jgi:hypothetical protein